MDDLSFLVDCKPRRIRSYEILTKVFVSFGVQKLHGRRNASKSGRQKKKESRQHCLFYSWLHVAMTDDLSIRLLEFDQ